MRFDEVYKWSGVLHLNVGAITLWEFDCAVRGYREAHGGKPKSNADMSEDRLSALGIEGF